MKGYSVGDAISFSGVITSAKPGRAMTEYVLHTGGQKIIFSSVENLEKGNEVEVSGRLTGILPFQMLAQEIKESKGVYDEVVKKIEEKTALGGFIKNNPATEGLADSFYAVAKRFASAKELNRAVLLRFHNDADGIAGAFALGEYLYFKPLQQNGAVYAQRDVVNDMGYLYHERKPLVILLDFGSNAKSAKQLELLRASGAEIILIDHHPLESEARGIPHLVLSPWLLGIESHSSYTAGYLAAELASLLGIDSGRYARIACAGDKSHVCEPQEEDRRAALVLDYLATNTRYGNNLVFYKNVLQKEELFSSIHLQAEESIEAAAEKAMSKMKEKEKGDFRIFIAPLSGLVSRGEFPNRSKITTAVFDKVKSEKPTVVIGHGGGAIILRANKECLQKGLDFSTIISSMALRFSGIIRAGGGHALAAAVHTNRDYEQTIIDALIEQI